MKATAKPTALPIDDFHGMVITGRAFNKPIPANDVQAARDLLMYSRRAFREIVFKDGATWFIVDGAGAMAGGLERTQ